MITILNMEVYNTPGVLDRVAGLFRHNGWNIESISAGVSNGSVAYINVSFKNRYVDMRLLAKQISRMDSVISWTECTPETHFAREMLLLKVKKSDADNIALAGQKTIHEEGGYVFVECTGAPWEIDEILKSIDAAECKRSGAIMISKGGGV